MFINCPHCRFLVALDTDGLPLARCPNCAARLRDEPEMEAIAVSPVSALPGASTTHLEPDAPEQAAATGSPATTGASSQHKDPDVVTATRATVAITDEVSTSEEDIAYPAAPPLSETQVGAMDESVEAAPPASDSTQARQDQRDEVHSSVPEPIESPVAPSPELEQVATLEPAPPTATHEVDPANQLAPAIEGEHVAPVVEADVVHVDLTTPAPSSVTVSSNVESGTDISPPPAVDEPGTPVVASETVRESDSEARALTDDPPLASRSAYTAEPDALDESDDVEAVVLPIPASAARKAKRRADAAVAPSFARRSVPAPPVDHRRARMKAVAIGALALLLLAQLLLADRTRLAGDARWRPMLVSTCGVLRCTLPPWREPRAFQVLERDVRAHAAQPGALRVTARMRNGARWAQPWPTLQLTFADAHGRSIATRMFQPREYLEGQPTQTLLGSGQSATVSMDIVEPGTQAVAFTFDFH